MKRTNKRKVNNPPNARDAASLCVSMGPERREKENLMEQKTAVATNSKKRSLKS
jgi:hypothetical protein